jgi:catechol 2,3-dioxygenase-like lactoylglutathione lyase family enzyme
MLEQGGAGGAGGSCPRLAAMTLLRIDHIQLAMPEGREAEARRFYAGLLGLREVAKPPGLAARGGAWFEGGEGIRLHLGVEREFRPARKAHPGFIVRDLPGLATRLRDAGFDTLEDAPIEGCDRLFTHDPFGNRIELIEPKS